LRTCWVDARMGIRNLWQEARGHVLRKRWDRLNQRIDALADPARAACLDYIKWRFDPLSSRYLRSSKRDRRRILKHAQQTSRHLRDSGNWPSALGLCTMLMNIEVRELPGVDANVVKSASDALITEARTFSSSISPIKAEREQVIRHPASLKARARVVDWEQNIDEALASTRSLRRQEEAVASAARPVTANTKLR
jgi:hypothetical protein